MSAHKINLEETKPILQDSGVYIKAGQSSQPNQSGQQHLIIQPVEFDYRHRNMYGYFALAAFVLVLINYLMLKERACQFAFVNGFKDFDLIQSFHMTALIVSIIVFVLSYFNFAMVISDFKLLFYTSAALIFVCSGMLIYNAIAITTAPCVSIGTQFNGFIQALGVGPLLDGQTNIFSAQDGIGITVFFFDIAAGGLLFLTGRKFYQRC